MSWWDGELCTGADICDYVSLDELVGWDAALFNLRTGADIYKPVGIPAPRAALCENTNANRLRTGSAVRR